MKEKDRKCAKVEKRIPSEIKVAERVKSVKIYFDFKMKNKLEFTVSEHSLLKSTKSMVRLEREEK